MSLLLCTAMHLSTRTQHRNAARLFFWAKLLLGNNKRAFSLDELMEKEPPFTRYEVKKYLQILKNNFWLGHDRNGIYYIRGRKFFFSQHCADKKTALSVNIPASALLDKKAWADFIFAAAITGVGKTVVASAKASGSLTSLCSEQADMSRGIEVPVALSIISTHTGQSTSAASRARKRAGITHLKVTEVLKPIVIATGAMLMMGVVEFKAFKEHLTAGNHFRLIKGQVYEQLPSTVSLLGCKRKRLAGPCKKGEWKRIKVAVDLTFKH